MVAHAFNLRICEAEVGRISEFRANLVYTISSRTAGLEGKTLPINQSIKRRRRKTIKRGRRKKKRRKLLAY